jgi:hypothetical protein
VSTITIQFQGDFSFVPTVPVPVEVIDRDMRIVAETTVPLGSPKPVEVSASGRVLVRAVLPSGECVATNVTVPVASAAEPNPSVTATLSSTDPSPHEGTAWAYTVQGLQRATSGRSPAVAAVLARGAMAPSPPSQTTLVVTAEQAYRNAGASGGVFRLQRDPHVYWLWPGPPGDRRVVTHFEARRPELETLNTTQWWPSYLEIITAVFPEDPEDFHFSDSPPGRLLVAAPPFTQSEIVLVESDADTTAHPVRPLVGGGDPRADAILSYLTQGAFADARTIGGSITDAEIQDILLQKRKDPASAVVSVYYQLRAGTVARPDWVKNLADWFVMIPDGAVQYGWCLLRQASPDYVTARTFFLTAAQRGVPMYSYGVRLLYDGLNLLAERDAGDTEVAAAFRAVRRLAAVIDWRSAFTSLALTETDSAVTLSE